MRKQGLMITVATLVAALTSIVVFQNCGSKGGGGGGGSSSSGPVDGNYRMVTYTCGSRDILNFYASDGITSVLINVSNTGGTQTFISNSGCQASTPLSFSYVDSTHLTTLATGGINCSGNCPAQCTTQGTPSDSAPTFMTYTLNGGTLSLYSSVSSTDLGQGSDMSQVGCRIGDPVTTILVRQ